MRRLWHRVRISEMWGLNPFYSPALAWRLMGEEAVEELRRVLLS